ncbi:MAG: penicillin-binding protein activator [Gammaproteobacteria bacterium]|nr:penicillin-binding protein activator [Gammaproteobacteria bacterium]
MPARIALIATRFSALFLFAALLSSCALGPPSGEDPQFTGRMEQLEALLEEAPGEAAARYEFMADTASGERQNDLYLLAAAAWLRARDIPRAEAILERLAATPLSQQHRIDRDMLAAELQLNNNNPRAALEIVNFPEEMLTIKQRNSALELRARALFQMGAALEALQLMLQRADESLEPAETERLYLAIWEGLSQSREPLDSESLPDDADRDTRAWVNLGAIGQTAWQAPFEFTERLKEWQTRHAGHPANRLLLPRLIEDFDKRLQYPKRIALLLPLSGRFANAATAVRDGLFAARFQSPDASTMPEVIVFDTGGSPNQFIEKYQEAVALGVDIIIGPLTKEELAILATLESLPVTTLGLNYLDATYPYTENLYQFGLLPEDEAAQAADRVIQEGKRHGVALAPDSEWGRRMLQAFATRFEELGGTLLSTQYYLPDNPDFSTPIMRMLNIDESRIRHQNLRSVLGLNIQFEPRRRQDIDFVFLAARDREARLIRPQLRFHQAINLPVYATSHIHRLGRQNDRDLDGISFADMPWTLMPDDMSGGARAQLETLWPNKFLRSSRLYALGFDAYRLIPVLLNFNPPLPHPTPGMTGLLALDQSKRIRRGLYWARFRNGTPRILAAPGETVEEL